MRAWALNQPRPAWKGHYRLLSLSHTYAHKCILQAGGDPLSSLVLYYPLVDLLALAAFLAYLRIYQPIGVRGEDEGMKGRLYPWFLYM